MPELWVSRGNVPALTRLLCAIIPRGAADIAANNQMESILGIFQNLVTKKSRIDVHGFDVLEAVVLSFSG
jgi:exportin-2 (importin alpha re-exporter)